MVLLLFATFHSVLSISFTDNISAIIKSDQDIKLNEVDTLTFINSSNNMIEFTRTIIIPSELSTCSAPKNCTCKRKKQYVNINCVRKYFYSSQLDSIKKLLISTSPPTNSQISGLTACPVSLNYRIWIFPIIPLKACILIRFGISPNCTISPCVEIHSSSYLTLYSIRSNFSPSWI